MTSGFEQVREHGNEKLSQAEAKEMVELIGDPRLTLDPEHSEYFNIATKKGVRHVQLLRVIPYVQEDGAVNFVRMEKHLRQVLAELNEETPDSDS